MRIYTITLGENVSMHVREDKIVATVRRSDGNIELYLDGMNDPFIINAKCANEFENQQRGKFFQW